MEGISFFIMPPSCFASVYPLKFLQVCMFGKALGQGACLGSPYFGNDLNLGLYPTLKGTICLQFEAQGPKVPHQTWKYHMLQIHDFSFQKAFQSFWILRIGRPFENTMKIEQRVFRKRKHKSHHILREKKS
jgi:hypothetical protein